MSSSIRDLADAYLVLSDRLTDPEDKMLALDTLFSAYIAEGRGLAQMPRHDHVGAPGGTEAPQEVVGYPGYEVEDFQKALLDVGYLDVDMAWGKWQLAGLEDMDLAARQEKMAAIRSLSKKPPVAEQSVSNVIHAFAGPQESVRTDYCPRCGSQGVEMHTKAGNKLFYKCSNKECRRPNGRDTLWDPGNWQKVKAE